MKIIHVTAGIQETCGVSQYVVNTARAQQAAGHDVTIITTTTCGYPVSNLRVFLVPDPLGALHEAAGGDVRDTIVHIHSMWGAYIHCVAVWCRKHGVAYVISPHGAATPWAMRYKWWKKIPAWWLYQRWDFRFAAGFHATVPDEEGDVRRLGFRQPVAVAPLGADVVEDAKRCAQASGSYRDVVFLSRIHPKKNVPALLRAWALLRAQSSDEQAGNQTGKRCVPRLVIAGSNDVGHQEELVALAKELGLRVVDFSHDLEFGKKTIFGGGEVPVGTFRKRLADCEADVVFTGPVYSEAKDWMFAHAWVSVLPSHSENFGGVVIESLAQGTPVVASTGTPWQILETGCEAGSDSHVRTSSGHGRCGWWVAPTPEALCRAIRTALDTTFEEYDKMSENAIRLVREKYSWRASADAVLRLYGRVLAGREDKTVGQ